jgi:hypothetical protein
VADAADVGGAVVLWVDRVELREAVVERLAELLVEVLLRGGGMIVAVIVVVGETQLEEALLDAGEVSVPAAVEVVVGVVEVVVGAVEVVVGAGLVEDAGGGGGGGGGATAELLGLVEQVVVVTVMVEVMSTQFLKKSAKRVIYGGRVKSHQRCSMSPGKGFNEIERVLTVTVEAHEMTVRVVVVRIVSVKS